MAVPGGGQFRTAIYYGPWQCRHEFMDSCRNKCAGEGYALMGCIWLADMKMDFEGTVLQTGSRFGMTHCCCNYPTRPSAETEVQRKRWDAIRDTFREQWAKRFGEWPTEPNGTAYQGHHRHDLWHGGNPTDWENVFPTPVDIHRTLFRVYNQCYAGSAPWNSVGPDYPYGE